MKRISDLVEVSAKYATQDPEKIASWHAHFKNNETILLAMDFLAAQEEGWAFTNPEAQSFYGWEDRHIHRRWGPGGMSPFGTRPLHYAHADGWWHFWMDPKQARIWRELRNPGARRPRTPKHYLDALRRRETYLAERIEEKTQSGSDPAYDLAERAALRWAIEQLNERFS